jgi:hypothetical protein
MRQTHPASETVGPDEHVALVLHGSFCVIVLVRRWKALGGAWTSGHCVDRL